jgi:hypothetical protein
LEKEFLITCLLKIRLTHPLCLITGLLF